MHITLLKRLIVDHSGITALKSRLSAKLLWKEQLVVHLTFGRRYGCEPDEAFLGEADDYTDLGYNGK
jgi:hypothetical protein